MLQNGYLSTGWQAFRRLSEQSLSIIRAHPGARGGQELTAISKNPSQGCTLLLNVCLWSAKWVLTSATGLGSGWVDKGEETECPVHSQHCRENKTAIVEIWYPIKNWWNQLYKWETFYLFYGAEVHFYSFLLSTLELSKLWTPPFNPSPKPNLALRLRFSPGFSGDCTDIQSLRMTDPGASSQTHPQ